MYDIIGDVHGHADELKNLLTKLGYERKGPGYKHPDRKVIFVGDYIDRGDQIKETLSIVRSMTDDGNAIALMGNHEYNAICYHTRNEDGNPLREHSQKNQHQHAETLIQFSGTEKELAEYINWFKTLPLFYEHPQFRVVHACWDEDSISHLKSVLGGNVLNDEAILRANTSDTDLYDAFEIVLKGKEVKIPLEYPFIDKDKHPRNEIRVKWWLDPATVTLKEYSIQEYNPAVDISLEPHAGSKHYSKDEIPVFFGHYWLENEPTLYRDNVCCLDYSVAKGGKLVAYQYNDETQLKNSSFIW